MELFHQDLGVRVRACLVVPVRWVKTYVPGRGLLAALQLGLGLGLELELELVAFGPAVRIDVAALCRFDQDEAARPIGKGGRRSSQRGGEG